MFPSFNLLVFTGLMLGRDVLCLPQYTNVGSVNPPTVTTLVTGEQSELLLSTITSERPLFTPALEPNTTKIPPIDRTDAGSETMTTITMSDGRTKTVPLPFPMPTVEPPEDEDH